jgi:hypothetical protein
MSNMQQQQAIQAQERENWYNGEMNAISRLGSTNIAPPVYVVRPYGY